MKVQRLLKGVLLVAISGVVGSSWPDENVDGSKAERDVTLNCNGISTPRFCIDCFTPAYCTSGHCTEQWLLGNSCNESPGGYGYCPPATPFCSGNGICTVQRDPTNSLCDEQILDQILSCNSQGYFPEPLNCHMYYVCPDPINIPIERLTRYICPEGYVYDRVHFNCKKQRLEEDCVTMMCTRANTYITYPGNENLYGFCKGPGIPQLFKCPAGQIFNLLRSTCEIIGI